MSGYTGRFNQKISIKTLFHFEGRTPVTTTTTKSLRGYLGPAKRPSGSANDGSPRQRPTHRLYFALRTVGVDSIIPPPGSIVTAEDGKDYEVLGQAREMVANRRAYGWEVPVIETSVLYPNTGLIGNQAGAQDGAEEIAFSLWPGTEIPLQRGEYDDLFGEAPASAWQLLRVTNASLTLDGDVYRITSALLNMEQPHVALRVRRRDS